MNTSSVSSEAELSPFLKGLKKEEKVTWEEFGNSTLETVISECGYWNLSPQQTMKVQNIWNNIQLQPLLVLVWCHQVVSYKIYSN